MSKCCGEATTAVHCACLFSSYESIHVSCHTSQFLFLLTRTNLVIRESSSRSCDKIGCRVKRICLDGNADKKIEDLKLGGGIRAIDRYLET